MMRLATLFLIFLVTVVAPANALSVKDFEAKPDAAQASYVAGFVEKMTADIGRTNPQLMQAIREWFSRTPEGKRLPEGIEKFTVELAALDLSAKDGKVDLSRIQIEGVVVKVVKDKFPPQK